MIKKIKIDEITAISKYIWDVYEDENKRTTPPYHSLKDVETHLLRGSKYKGNQYLGVYEENNLKGVVLLYGEEDNQYLSVQGPYIHNSYEYKEIACEMMDYIKSNYKGFQCHFGTTKTNVLSQEFLIAQEFLCTEDTIQMSITKETLMPIETQSNIQLLTEERMDKYKIFHDIHYHDYYWLSDRIYKVMNQWKIHVVLENDKIIGSVFTRKQTEDSGEIYGCKVLEPYKSKQVMAELFYNSAKSWIDEGVKEILNFVPQGLEAESAALVGFKGYDTYMCYYKENI